MTADDTVRYELIARPSLHRERLDQAELVYAHYELVRYEDGEREVVTSGGGLSSRLSIVSYLREIARLGGPDAAAALAAMNAGWRKADGP